MFAVTAIVAVPPPAAMVPDGLPSVSDAAAPACVTVTVRVMPPPVTVTVALRELVDVLAVAVAVRVPLFEPLAGVTVSHV